MCSCLGVFCVCAWLEVVSLYLCLFACLCEGGYGCGFLFL